MTYIPWRGVCIHQTEGSDGPGLDTDDIRDFHKKQRRWLDVGYNFVCEHIERGYEVVVGRPLNVAGAHCRGYNTAFIGMALHGNFNEMPPLAVQLEVTARFLAGLMDSLHIPRDRVYYHRELCDTNCPGQAFPETEFRQLVARM